MLRPVSAVTLAVLAAVALAAPALAATPAAAAQPDNSASFEENYVQVTRGDTASITVSHDGPANLTIGSQETGFEVRIPLGGSGTDTVDLHTYNTTAANPDVFLSTGGTEMNTPPLDESIEDGQYQMTVTMDGVTEAVGTLDVESRNDTASQPGVAPADIEFEDSDPGDVHGLVTNRETVARGDYAAFVVNESGLEWALSDSSTDANLDSAVTAEIVELDPEPNTVAEEFSVDRVVSQVGESDRFVVLWDTSDVEVDEGTNNTYELRLALTERSELVDEDEQLVRERVTVAEPQVSLTAEPGFELAPWDGRTVTVDGETNVAPGTTLDVRALQESSNAFWKHTQTVSANGAFSVSFDFSDASVPGEFPLWVLDYREASEETVSLTTENASLSFDAQQVSDGGVAVENVTLSHDGFVAVAANRTTLGVSEFLQSGSYESVRVSLDEQLDETRELNATAYVDVNRSTELDGADRPYNESGSVVRDAASVQPAPDRTDGNETSTSSPTDTTSTDTSDPSTTGRTLDVDESDPLTPVPANVGGGSSGGFVSLSPLVAFVGLVAGALLAVRQ